MNSTRRTGPPALRRRREPRPGTYHRRVPSGHLLVVCAALIGAVVGLGVGGLFVRARGTAALFGMAASGDARRTDPGSPRGWPASGTNGHQLGARATVPVVDLQAELPTADRGRTPAG